MARGGFDMQIKITNILLMIIVAELGFLSYSQYMLPTLADIKKHEAALERVPVTQIIGHISADITNPEEIRSENY